MNSATDRDKKRLEEFESHAVELQKLSTTTALEFGAVQ